MLEFDTIENNVFDLRERMLEYLDAPLFTIQSCKML